MKKYCFYKIIMFIVITFISILNVKAITSFPDSLEAYKEDSGITLNNNHSLEIDLTHNANSTHNYPYFHRKFSSQGDIICVSGLGYREPSDGLVYNKTSWANVNQAKGVAYILNKIIGEGGASLIDYEKYYWSEVMINAYLGTYIPKSNSYMQYYVIDAEYIIPGTGLTYNQLIENANAYANADYSANLSTSTTNLTFSLGTDGYYYSNPVTITSDTNYTVKPNTSLVIAVKDGDKYTFKVKGTDIIPGTKLSFSVTISNESKSYYTAQRYTYSSNYQDLTLGQTLKNTVSGKTITLNGSIEREGTTLLITKKDSVTKKGIEGVVFDLYKSSDCTGTTVKKDLKTNSLGQISISNLEIGTYSLKETTVPSGYVTPTNTCTKVVLNSGENNVEIENQPLGGVTIIKIDSKTKNAVVGAKLKLLNDKKEVIAEWISDGNAFIIEELPAGKYTIEEVSAASGYILKTTSQIFEIKNGDNLVNVVVENDQTVVKINKTRLVDGKLLEGATLEIQDADGNVVKYCKDEAGNDIECKWISSNEEYIIYGMPIGTYYLVETSAPEGYALNIEKIEFKVDGKTPIIKVEMKNALEEEVPDTLSSRSALLLAIAMFDIALGIGIITYVKKNKIEQ